ncbi:MAG: flagellar hook-length control protein FliK [Phenylobacterium sp.]|uniref:flagellar hook-length control protein FliK n=1 Tax=Phenylobacterium sp. TaxID=1871053 RepID=UPI001B478908|nr:flagellar hook-length control protein FliK [Phenylobacterium sp.]MBP7648484.1 flagellar hook-length control protein FliK [Phenylobacterium sp.]MBP7817014.1 flagellar hook-length control protein FliK [Phenylobacterium sp.]MBP9230440.1 flagellar hook-length control protein FliK [Phenylobacterium sp.]MBP9754311.1 flagellar hook-length control protein FliK [Phenylobacterium sp.]
MKVAPLGTIPTAAQVPALTPVRPVARVQGGQLLREMQRAVEADAVDSAQPVEALARVAAPKTAGQPGLAPLLPQTPAQAMAQALRSALTRQSGLAPLMADLSQALRAQALSPPARAAALQMLSQLIPLDPAVRGADIKRALKTSGLFLEANLAADPETSPLGGDLKAALLVLRQALGPATRRPPGATPPPPYGGAPTSAQKAALPSLSLGADPGAISEALAAETQGALAHIDLLQMASLPEPDRPGEPTRWWFETPLQTPQGPGVAQFEISRDSQGRARDEDREPLWRARFSVDFEPVGPIDAQVAFEADLARVSLWVLRADAAERLRAAQPMLARALAAAGLQLELAVHSGPPPAPATTAGRLLDQSA